MNRITFFLSISLLTACQHVSEKKISTDNWHQATKQVTQQYQPLADKHLKPAFEKAGVTYPGKKITLLAFKHEANVELWAQDSRRQWKYIKRYKMTAQSGKLGPKLREGDYQVPEGIYSISFLNPFSQWHLSMGLNYPNATDRSHAKRDGRTNLGSEIYLHGNKLSAGCIALGDRSISELFVLASHIGNKNIDVVIAPNDLRHRAPMTDLSKQPKWVADLYRQLGNKLSQFKNTDIA